MQCSLLRSVCCKAGGPRRDDDEDGPRRMEDIGPSKADESADWGADRKPQSSFGGGGGFGDRDRPARTSGFGGDSAAADSADSWGSRRPAASAAAPPRRAGGAFGGFERDDSMGSGGGFVPSDRPPRRAGGFDDASTPGAADGESRWGSKFMPGEPRRAPSAAADEASSWASRRPPSTSGDAPAAAAAPTSRPRLNIKPRTAPSTDTTTQNGEADQQGEPSVRSEDQSEADAAAPEAPTAPARNPFGAAKPRDERLVAAARAEQSEQSEPEAAAAAPAAAPAPRSNPFGAARPREHVLREQGRSDPDAAAPRCTSPRDLSKYHTQRILAFHLEPGGVVAVDVCMSALESPVDFLII